MKAPAAPSLTGAVYGFVLLSTFVASIILLFGMRNEARQYEHTVQASALHVRSTALAQSIAEALEREWASLSGVAEVLPEAAPEEAQRLLDMIVREDGIVTWAGFAGTDGRISIASDRMRDGEDVSGDEWFRRGLIADYVADASGIPRPLGSQSKESARAVDLARPVSFRDGRTIGVLAYRIDPGWPLRAITQKAMELGIDVALVDAEGQIRLRGGTSPDVPFDARLAVQRISEAQPRFDDRGNSYLMAVNNVSLHNMPQIGWRIASRIAAQTSGDARAELTAGMISILAALFAEVMLATYAFIRVFVRPLRDLAKNAKAISEGADIYPYADSSSVEVAEISSALARMQTGSVETVAPDVSLGRLRRARDMPPLVGHRTIRGNRRTTRAS